MLKIASQTSSIIGKPLGFQTETLPGDWTGIGNSGYPVDASPGTSTMRSPYAALGKRSFWKSGVFDRHALDLGDIYLKKFDVGPSDRIATAGSCFAQHIAAQFRDRGFNVIDAEPPPHGVSKAVANTYGFQVYSARYGNIYTARQLLQLAQECLGQRSPRDIVWERDGRFFDALRPSVEPTGLPSQDLVEAHRAQHLSRVGWLLESATLFVFTLGLTETWVHRGDGTAYPTAPGTIAGSYDATTYSFKNFSYDEVLADLNQFRTLVHGINPNIRFIITVSPVPLTATAGPEHVLPATVYSKSVLRAVAGYMAMSFDDVDYFPAYEIIAGTPARGFFFESNMRSVSPMGVATVMRSFFAQHRPADAPLHAPATSDPATSENASVLDRSRLSDAERAEQAAYKAICEEQILEAFVPR